MELRFLGIGAAFNPLMGNTGAFFTRGENFFMIDCGEQAFYKLTRAGILDQFTGTITLIQTHLHADHSGALGTLVLYATEVLGRKVTIVHPNDEIQTLLRLMGVKPEQYTLRRDFVGGGLMVTPISTQHVDTIPAFSYRLTDEDGTIFYSGDTRELSQDVLEGLRDGSLRRAYLDVSYFEKPPARTAHLPYAELIELVEPPLRSKCTIMHLNRDYRDIAEGDGFAVASMDPVFG